MQRKQGAVPAVTPLRCWICCVRLARSQKPWSICDAKSCATERERIYSYRRAQREASLCRTCTPSARGGGYCAAHAHYRQPCACGGLVPKAKRGGGPRSMRCPACEARCARVCGSRRGEKVQGWHRSPHCRGKCVAGGVRLKVRRLPSDPVARAMALRGLSADVLVAADCRAHP